MTVCPIAIIASCKKCPMFKMCPLKSVLGDHHPKKDESSKSKKKEK